MAYPYQITTGAVLPSPAFGPGPYFNGSGIYVVLVDKPNAHAEVWKSSDAGVTWAEQDSGNHKSLRVFAATTDQVVQTFQFGTKLFITYTHSSGDETRVAEFSMASDTWGTVITGGPTVATGQFGNARITVRISNGELRCYYPITDGAVSDLNRSTYNGSTWETPVTILDGAASDPARILSAVVDTSDNVGVLVLSAGPTFRFRADKADESLGTIQQLRFFQPSVYVPGSSTGVFLSSGSLTRFVFPMALHHETITTSTYARVGLFLIDGAIATRFCTALLIADTYLNYETVSGEAGLVTSFSLIGSADPRYVYYVWLSSMSTGDFAIKRACCNVGCAVSVPSTVFTPSAGVAQRIEYISTGMNGADAGIVFSARIDNAAYTYRYPHYYQETPTCSADSPCGGAASTGRYRIS
jgi:hypothetical protein